MSVYRNFNRCVVCRSKTNLHLYKGEFEVTMLLNTLYLTVIHLVEKRKGLRIKSKKMVNWLNERSIIDMHGNEFNTDEIVQYLRNGLAHFNIKIDDSAALSERAEITGISIFGINEDDKVKCKSPCEIRKCKPRQYQTNNCDNNSSDKNSICTFRFTVKKLEEFTLDVINSALEKLDKSACSQDCIDLHQRLEMSKEWPE
ncbi:MAG: HEPN family nuclease [Chitinispirillia bacterium]|nr:HEPN family nuclease [Chitinispirillia bacterium]MCL2269557.1 HEPN family nuclease [Chitinispirillia bacterium]